MQGLPFDDAEFPPPGPPVSTSWDQSPRLPIISPNPNPVAAAPVTDEELYRLVGAPPPSPPAPPDDLIRYSQQMPIVTAQHLHTFQQHAHNQPSPSSQPHTRHRQDLHYRPIPHSQLPHPSNASRIPVTATTTIHRAAAARQHATHVSTTRQRSSIAHAPQPLDVSRPSSSQNPIHMRVGQQDSAGGAPAPPHLSRQSVPQPMSVSPGRVSAFRSKDSPKRPKRSAVEEARIRAQREAETFASSRRDTTKREASLHSAARSADGPDVEVMSDRRQSSKRMRVETEPNSSNEYQSSRKKIGSGDEEPEKADDECEAEKKERYKRRLDMNRESAAVSRVRRRAYVKELEERLAAVEGEKLQLEGKLEIMMSQNDSLKKQLENLFLMVASGRRPTYPVQGSSQTQGLPSGPPHPPPSGEGG